MDDKLKIFAPDLETASAYFEAQGVSRAKLLLQQQKGKCKHGECETVIAFERQGLAPSPLEDCLIGVVHICPDCAAVKMLDLPAGRVTLIVGPTGSGKTFIADALAAADTNAVKIDGLTGDRLHSALRKVPRHKPMIVCVQEIQGKSLNPDEVGVSEFAEFAGRECRGLEIGYYC